MNTIIEPGTKVRLKDHTELPDWDLIPSGLQEQYLTVENSTVTIKCLNSLGHYEFCENVGFTCGAKVFDIIAPFKEYSKEDFEHLFD